MADDKLLANKVTISRREFSGLLPPACWTMSCRFGASSSKRAQRLLTTWWSTMRVRAGLCRKAYPAVSQAVQMACETRRLWICRPH